MWSYLAKLYNGAVIVVDSVVSLWTL
jgi:hypothetical protein